MKRRQLLRALAGGLGFSLSGGAAASNGAWPERPLRMIVPFSAGGMTDVVARLLSAAMSTELGQQVIVENRTGAGGNIAASLVANARKDGYTLLFVSHLLAINKTAYRQLDYDLERDFEPIGDVGASVIMVVVRRDFPARDLHEFVAYMKAHAGAVNVAVAGVGPTAAYFAMASGAEFTTVPYKGNAPALADVVAGRVDAIFIALETVLPYLERGSVRALAVMSHSKRTPFFPDIAAAAETIPGFEAPGFLGLATTKGVPSDVIARLSRALRSALRKSELQEQFRRRSIEVVESSPSEFGQRISREVERWAVVVKSTNNYVN